MLRALSHLGRPSALVASFAIHAGAVAVGGHGWGVSSMDRLRADVVPQQTVEVELEPPPEPLPPASSPADEVAGVRAGPSAVAHRHPYPVSRDHDARPHAPSLVHLPFAPEDRAAEGAVSDVVEAPPDAPVHFVLPSAKAVGGTAIAGAGAQGHEGEEQERGEPTTYDAADVSTPARLLSSAPVDYPDDARAAQIETDVEMELTVDARGRVVLAKGVSTRGYGLEKAAVRAVEKYVFSPAIRRGHPVTVRMRWTVQFRLQ